MAHGAMRVAEDTQVAGPWCKMHVMLKKEIFNLKAILPLTTANWSSSIGFTGIC